MHEVIAINERYLVNRKALSYHRWILRAMAEIESYGPPPERSAMNNTVTGLSGTLTDGTGVSAITGSKLLKDFVLDVALAIPAGLLAINVGGIEQALVASTAVAFVAGDAVVKALYRVILRWAQS